VSTFLRRVTASLPRRSPAYNITVRSRSGRVLSPISESPVTGGMVYGRKARNEALRRAAADRDLSVVSVKRRSRADARIARSAAREYRRARTGIPASEAWEQSPDAFRHAVAEDYRCVAPRSRSNPWHRADAVLGRGTAARVQEAMRQANSNPWDVPEPRQPGRTR
jgi:hypothetical protein